MTAERREATFVSPTGGYVVAAFLGVEEGWCHLLETLLARGYVLEPSHDGDGHAS